MLPQSSICRGCCRRCRRRRSCSCSCCDAAVVADAAVGARAAVAVVVFVTAFLEDAVAFLGLFRGSGFSIIKYHLA